MMGSCEKIVIGEPDELLFIQEHQRHAYLYGFEWIPEENLFGREKIIQPIWVEAVWWNAVNSGECVLPLVYQSIKEVKQRTKESICRKCHFQV